MGRYSFEEGGGYSPDDAVIPALVNTPVFFIAPSARTVSSGELWVAISCDDPNYGGCVVWLSNDGDQYYRIRQIFGSAIQGVLTTALASATGTDEANTLAVDLSQSNGLLESVSQQTVDVWDSLCFVGGELLAFRDADLTGDGLYDLTYLKRGLYSSTTGADSGDPFVLLNDTLLKYRFNKNAVGSTLYFKFQGFNTVGAGYQDLADLVEYPVAITADGGIKALLSDIASPDWTDITGKPTTLAGYGITDAVGLDSPAFTGVPTVPALIIGEEDGLQIVNVDFLYEIVRGNVNQPMNDAQTGVVPLWIGSVYLLSGAYTLLSAVIGSITGIAYLQIVSSTSELLIEFSSTSGLVHFVGANNVVVSAGGLYDLLLFSDDIANTAVIKNLLFQR